MGAQGSSSVIRAVAALAAAVALALLAGCGSSSSTTSPGATGASGATGEQGQAPAQAQVRVTYEKPNPKVEGDGTGYQLLQAAKTKYLATTLASTFQLPHP